MSSKTVCITSLAQVGTTFFDWSMHWLAGDSEVYVNDTWCELPADPVKGNNAHQHPKNHPQGLGEFLHCIGQLQQQPVESFHSCYPGSTDIDHCAEQLGITVNSNQAVIKWLIDTTNIDFAQIVQQCFNQSIPLIFIGAGPELGVYQMLSQARDNEHDYLAFHQRYFAGKLTDCVEVWDQREMLALNLQTNYCMTNEFFDFGGPHLWINAEEFWFDTANTIKAALRYCDIPVVNGRWRQWHRVHESWMEIQLPMIKFTKNLDHIVMAILKGWNYSLPDLSLLQEAIILNRLIYQHNMNIKNWQLSKFPDNTNKLHKLLEHSHHSV